MDTLSLRTLAGPNLWSAMPVVVVTLPDEARLTRRQAQRVGKRLAHWLPGLTQHLEADAKHSLEARLARGLPLAELLPLVISELHFLARSMQPRPRHWRERRRGLDRLVIECEEPLVGQACAELAWRFVEAALDDRSLEVTAEITNLIDRAYYACFGANTRPIVEAARARGIPVRRLDAESIVQFGHGAKQRRMTTAMTDRISALAETISTNKDLTKRLLAEAGLPVPEGRVVASAEEAWRVARAIGEAVVIKPLDSDYGNGVTLNVRGREAVLAAYANARQWREQVIVERFQPGEEYRLLVIGGEVVSALRREPAYVIGDGRSTVRQLIEYENRQHRGHPLATLFPLPWDEEARALIAEQGLLPESTPASGRKVLLRRKYRTFSGGKNVDVTCQIHSALRDMVVAAAQQMNLEIAGVDVVAADIARPFEGRAGVIVEVNAGPALFEHMPPYVHYDRHIGDKIVDLLFQPGETGRIPLAAVLGRDAAAIASAIAADWEQTGLRTALATEDIWQVGPGVKKQQDGRSRERVQALLTNVLTEAAVVQVDPQDVLENGFGFDRCSLLVCLPPDDTTKVKEYLRLAARLGELLLAEGRAIIVCPQRCSDELMERFGDRALMVLDDNDLSQTAARLAQRALGQDAWPEPPADQDIAAAQLGIRKRRSRGQRALAGSY